MKKHLKNAERVALQAQHEAKKSGKEQIFIFEFRPSACRSCSGYHPTVGVGVDPQGRWTFYSSPYGFHSIVVSPHPPEQLENFEHAVIVLHSLMSRLKRYNSFAAYRFYPRDDVYEFNFEEE